MEKQSATQGEQHPLSSEKAVTKTAGYKYLLFLPEGYGEKKKLWPVILYLHGAIERGDDLEKVKMAGPPKVVQSKKDFPFILVSPQCPSDQGWSNDILIKLLDEVTGKYAVDNDRIYLTGKSMGGFGMWNLACAYPERFAAIAPISGGGEPALACNLKDVPVWAFHGAKDEIVPPEKSKDMVDAVKACGGDARLTVYPDARHDCWTVTYDNKELYDWFLEHRRNKKTE